MCIPNISARHWFRREEEDYKEEIYRIFSQLDEIPLRNSEWASLLLAPSSCSPRWRSAAPLSSVELEHSISVAPIEPRLPFSSPKVLLPFKRSVTSWKFSLDLTRKTYYTQILRGRVQCLRNCRRSDRLFHVLKPLKTSYVLHQIARLRSPRRSRKVAPLVG